MIDSRLEQRLGYAFVNVELLKQALTHRSVSQRNNYERLEFLGDALLGMLIAQYLFARYPAEDEGRLTRMRATLVRQETLAILAKSLELGTSLNLSSGEKKSGGHQRESILADVVEAIIGAMYLDCADIERVRHVVLAWYAPYVEHLTPGDALKDPKTRLQELLQGKKLPLPQYTLISVDGDAPNQFFTIECHVSGMSTEQIISTGQGTSRRNAEQTAASGLLKSLELVV